MKEFFEKLISEWWGITIIVVVALVVWVLLSALLYRPFFKRFYDVVLSGLAIIVLSPVLLILIVLGTIKMKGNPFFTQMRPGKINKRTGKEKIFKLIKFRTMTCEKDENGNLLPDEKRLTKYGKILRSTSLDELPELFNIFIGDMSIVGPRPLLVQYLPLYNEEQKHRHDVRPGLTGYAQVNGRNAISWEERFKLDVTYTQKISLWMDMGIIFKTVLAVFKREGISSETSATMEEFKGIKTE
jgi:lipopolysaccharide/colanic/teichoic acid biosynthesis glycosyltransferase